MNIYNIKDNMSVGAGFITNADAIQLSLIFIT